MNNNDTLPISIFLDYINKLDKEHYYLSDKYYLRIKKKAYLKAINSL